MLLTSCSVLGTFARNRCPRGKNCNFLHVFRNPNNEFKDADRDMWDSPVHSRRNSEREWRSSTRELERYKKQARARIIFCFGFLLLYLFTLIVIYLLFTRTCKRNFMYITSLHAQKNRKFCTLINSSLLYFLLI